MKERFPRTPHLPWSEKISDDDRRLDESALLECFSGCEVVGTEKLDGECTTLTRDYCYARSPDGRHHPSRDLVKRIWGTIRYAIPEGWRVVGENLTARHAIKYDYLPPRFPATSSPLLVFAVIDPDNTVLAWDDTLHFLKGLPISMAVVPTLWRGVLPCKIEQISGRLHSECRKRKSFFGNVQEGYVVRCAGSFPVEEYACRAAKFVAGVFVPGNENWGQGNFEENETCSTCYHEIRRKSG